jgi:hypothetical protein
MIINGIEPSQISPFSHALYVHITQNQNAIQIPAAREGCGVCESHEPPHGGKAIATPFQSGYEKDVQLYSSMSMI